MDLILAKLLGIYFIAIGLGLFFYPERFKMLYKDFSNSSPLLFLGGVIAIFLGAFIVSVHNVWVFNWPVIITLVGWLSLIKGAALIIYPETSKFFVCFHEMQERSYRILGCIWAVIGLVLLYNSCQYMH